MLSKPWKKSEKALKLAYQLDDSQAKSIAQETLSVSKEALAKDRQNRESLESKLHKNCTKARAQLAEDIEANERQQNTIQVGEKEMDEWKKESEDAQRQAIMAAVNLFVNGTLAAAAETDDVINGLQGATVRPGSKWGPLARSTMER